MLTLAIVVDVVEVRAIERLDSRPYCIFSLSENKIPSMLDTRVALLQALVRGESYGLELIDRVLRDTNGRLTLMQGRVYPVLRELEQEGFVRSFDGESVPERSGRPRRYYELTAEGRRVAKADAAAIRGLFSTHWEPAR